MRRSVVVQGAALLASAALVGLSAAPASAAPPVAQASATALTLGAGGSGTGSGTYSVTNDGHHQSTSGSNEPVVSALGGQRLVSAGSLVQDATTHAAGTSAACSGIAGNDATLVEAGEGSCLSGGSALTMDIAHLDFSHLDVVSSPLFEGLDQPLKQALAPYQKQLTDALSSGLRQAVQSLGSPGVYLDLGTVLSHCTANRSAASGGSDLADAAAYVKFPGQGRVDLVSFPAHPAPNAEVVTGLGNVARTLQIALRSQLTKSLRGSLAPLGLGIDQVSPVIDQALDQIGAQLQPLQDNLLRATLNKQSLGDDSIAVTALDLSVLPAAQQFVDADAMDLSVGTSTCGPNGRVAPTGGHPAPPSQTPPHKNTAVPTAVTAGLADGSSLDEGHGSAGRTAIVALLLLTAGGSAAAAYRRTLRR